MTRRIGHYRHGMAMLEIIASLAVLIIGLLGAVHLYFFGLDRMQTMGEGEQAMRAVRNEIEATRAMPWEALALRDGAPFIEAGRDLADLPDAVSRVSVRDLPETQGLLREVTATVTWRGEHGRGITKRATTYVALRSAT